ncbi:MAG: DMT family transporter [Planctomycetaceae bacterium]
MNSPPNSDGLASGDANTSEDCALDCPAAPWADDSATAAALSGESHDDHQPLSLSAGLFTLLLALLWAGTSVTAREAVDRVPPLAVGGIRFGLATIFMLGWCQWEKVPLRLHRGQWLPAVVMAVLLFLQIATFNLGVAWSTASHSTLLVNTYIFWVAIADHFFTRALRLNGRQWTGLLIAALGAALLFIDTPSPGPAPVSAASLPSDARMPAGIPARDAPSLPGDATLALSAFLLAIKVLYTKAAVRHVPPGTLIFWHDLLGTLLFLGFSGLFETWHPDPWTPAIVDSLLYAGLIVSGFCFAAHAWLLKRHGASQISVFSFATPVFGVFLAVLFRGDQLSAWLLLSGLLVAVGIVFVNRP